MSQEALVEGVFLLAPARETSLVLTLALGVVLAGLTQGSALGSCLEALTLGTLTTAVLGAGALTVLLELALELLLGSMLLEELLDWEVYFVEEDGVRLRDKVGELGTSPVDLDTTLADVLLDITTRA